MLRKNLVYVMIMCIAMFGFIKGAFAKDKSDFLSLSLEELMEIEVTTVAKKKQEFFKTPAAIYVVTAEDLKRSGATSIAEALRIVPGLHVASINSHYWAISARGTNAFYANKLLVMIDGRSVYTPIYSGVYWDVQDMLLTDVERIEVIRGPGGTLWGANAVNGIINIITKSSKKTQGGIVTGGGGTEELGFGGVRYGGKIGKDIYYRIYTKYFYRDNWVDSTGANTNDEWQAPRGGFRIDWNITNKDLLTLIGNGYYVNKKNTTAIVDLTTATLSSSPNSEEIATGGNFIARLHHDFSEGHDFSFQMYYDITNREQKLTLEQMVNTIDLDFQHRFPILGWQEITWGVGYRFIKDKLDGTFTISFDPSEFSQHIVTGFVQDQITVIPDQLHLIVGSKFERNEYTGFEYQPSGRILWTPNENHTVWGSFTRAVRTPARTDEAIQLNHSPFTTGNAISVLRVLGNTDFKSEELMAGELGYRIRPLANLFFDIAGFYNMYDDLQTTESSAPSAQTSPVAHTVVPTVFENQAYARSYGIEVAPNWDVFKMWRLKGGFTWFDINYKLDLTSTDTTSEALREGSDPRYQFSLRSYLDLPYNIQFDVAGYFVDKLSNLGTSFATGTALSVGRYFKLDIRLGWRPIEDLEISIAAQNLTDSHHAEFQDISGVTVLSEPQRSFYGKLTWRF